MPPSRPPAKGYSEPGNGSVPDRPRLISPEFVAGYRRERMAVAVAELAHEDGVDELTTARMVARARMSRLSFYELFADKAKCLTYCCEFAGDRLAEPVLTAAQDPEPWPVPLERAIRVLLEAVAEQPLLAELCFVHSAALLPRGSELGHQAIVKALAAVTPGREERDAEDVPPSEEAEFVASAIASIVAQRIRAGEVDRLPALADELASLAVKLSGNRNAPGGDPPPAPAG